VALPDFDWDEANVRHLRRHRVLPEEFEQVIRNEPLDLEFENQDGEDRFKSLGTTDAGRVLIVVWTVRQGQVRAITAYPASKPYRDLFWRHRKG
jgi:uncharacterized DUF497 family protein